MNSRLYLDHNATTPPSAEVVQAVTRALTVDFGNPSSQHWAGQDATRTVDNARTNLANLLDCRADELTFTSGATEANNMAIFGVVEKFLAQGRTLAQMHIVTSAIEHKSVLKPCAELEAKGLRVTYVPAGWDGRVNPRQIEASIEADTILVSVMLANNDTGVIQPLEEIVQYSHGKGVLVHSDATQAVGKIPVFPRTLGLDLMSLSAHKFYGPKGSGALWMRNGQKLPAFIHGGKQELSLRAGTENTPGIAGQGAAAKSARSNLPHYAQHCSAGRDALQTGLLGLFPDMRIYGELAPRVPNTLCVGFPGVDGMTLMLNLDLEGIAVSVGSACGAGDHQPSHVLRGMGCTEQEALSTVRFSLGLATSAEQIERTLTVMSRIVPRLRSTIPSVGVH
jgi:cysteine desulfurase